MEKKKGGAHFNLKHMKVGKGASMHLGPVSKGGKAKASPQTSGHINKNKLMHDAKGHGAGFNAGQEPPKKGKGGAKKK